MPYPGFDDPALASIPPAGNLYFAEDLALSGSPGLPHYEIQPAETGLPGAGQEAHQFGRRVNLMFGTPETHTGDGQQIVGPTSASNGTRGHWSEVLNFHGSPAPWVLLGILIVAGLLHVSAGASGKVEL